MAIGVNGRSADDAGPGERARQRLFDAAVEAFAEKGFHGTTTRDIATAAQMSPAALYVHHRSKEDLLHQVSLAGHLEVLALCRHAIAAHDAPTDQLQKFVVDFARHHARNHTMARIVNYELNSLNAEHRVEIMELRAEMDGLMRDLVQRGADSGVFDVVSPAMTSAALLSLGIDVARWYDERGGWTPDQVAEHYRVLALRMVGAEPRP
ncbi:TetR/AcrR family transcriptional regulator [Nocardioides gilvus]|uniref:TetR/AcrR family transcriptional regulator n=1 Tax=Nocardioides gilvus TaxID=1735589 RepID=UPI000D7485B6|nr:TetR/AcrR family transcriptional regulator [Nocardioides gilvus]